MRDDLRADHVMIAGHGGDQIRAYRAQPEGDGPFGSVVVIHHMPGFDAGSKEITRRFAAEGYLALCPDLYWREAPDLPPDEAAALVRSHGGVPDDRLVGDVAGAATFLRDHPAGNGRVGVIGYCSGGRHAFLAACSLELEAAVDCYGAFVVGEPPDGLGLRIGPVVDLAPRLSCPLLGLFGSEDAYPSPEHVAELARALEAAGKDFTFHSFEGAGHAFFAVNREQYRPRAATEGWEMVLDFFGRHLAPA
jgi:carboxymethylenebutenolidase